MDLQFEVFVLLQYLCEVLPADLLHLAFFVKSSFTMIDATEKNRLLTTSNVRRPDSLDPRLEKSQLFLLTSHRYTQNSSVVSISFQPQNNVQQ